MGSTLGGVITGLAKGALVVVPLMIFILPGMARWYPDHSRSTMSRARVDQRRLAATMENLARSNAAAIPGTNVRENGEFSPGGDQALGKAISQLPAEGGQSLGSVRDPHAVGTADFRWYKHPTYGVVVGVGPDAKLNILPKDTAMPDANTARLAISGLTYDPTNGTNSAGDVVRFVDLTGKAVQP
jgi:hypothetical protein